MPAEEVPPEVLEARRKLKEKMGAGAQVGGKGSMRRKAKPVPKANHNDDRKVAEVCRKAGLQEIGGMDEANIIMNDGSVTQLKNPKLRGSMPSNAWVLNGASSQTHVSKLTPEMRGEGGAPSSGGGLPPQFESAIRKFQIALQSAGLSQEDVADPAKQQAVTDALANAGLTEEESQILSMLAGPAGGATGAGAEGDVAAPEKNFDEVADTD